MKTNLLAAVLALCLTSCAGTATNQLASPTGEWKTRTGQLAYHDPKISLIGDVIVRTSASGDMELTFSKAPALTLITIRQNEHFARASGPLIHGSWSGSPTSAPPRLRGWFALREKILAGGSSVNLKTGG